MNMAKMRAIVITIFSCSPLLSARTLVQPSQEETRSGASGTQHRVVQIDWRAELAARQKQLESNPNSAFLHNQVAIAYDALGDFEAFDREIKMAIKLDPGNPIDWYQAYAVYKRRHLKEKSVIALERALQIDPANPFGHYEKAGIFEDTRQWRQALKEYETTQQLLQNLKSDPRNFQSGSWRYIDPRGNPYDVTVQQSQIDGDLDRVRKKAHD